MNDYKKIAWDGLWKNNPGLVQLLGLCPLLAVTNTLVNAIGLGFATLLVLLCSNVLVSALRHLIPSPIRIAIFVMIIAALVSMIQLLMNAYAHDLYLSLGIFLPLIVTNCIIIGRSEGFASKQSISKAAFDGFMMGTGFFIVLIALGAARELIGQGTLFKDAHMLFGDFGHALFIDVLALETKFLLAILPPGAFFAMGLLIAAKNWLDGYMETKTIEEPEPTITRARVTGKP